MRMIIALFAGALFGLGLVVSGMTDTQKVQGFLDLFGAWDPTLIFVMGGAILPMLAAWQFAARREHSFTGSNLPSKPSGSIDKRLAIGAVMFGMGWALAGFCPGPALASISFGGLSGVIFVAAMLAGMFGHKLFVKSV